MILATSIEDVRRDITARLQSHPALKGVMVNRGQLINGEAAPVDDEGQLLPYVVLIFGGRAKVRASYQGIVGTRGDMRRLTFGAEVYARTTEVKDIVADTVSDILEGYQPAGEGEISQEYSGQIENPIDLKANHPREGIGLIFECMVNTTLPDDLVAPEPSEIPEVETGTWLRAAEGLPGYYDVLELPDGFDVLKD